MDHHYSVYGISLSSDIPFDFPRRAAGADGSVCVAFASGRDGEFGAAADTPPDAPFVVRELSDGAVYLRWSGLHEFLVDSGGTVVRHRALRAGGAEVLQNFLFGQTLSFALVRQRVEPVHAAVVDIGGCAIALLGDCTYGKSTLAAALVRTGCRLVSDDLLVVRERDGRLMAQPGTGRIKLLPDSASAVLGRDGGVPVIPNADKRVFRLDEPMVQRRELPLRAFVVLPTPDERAACDRIAIRRISRAQVFHELLANTFVRHLQGGSRLHQNFCCNARLSAAVDGYELRYPAGIARLRAVTQTVLRHFRHASQRDLR